jgi:hypothetical protein
MRATAPSGKNWECRNRTQLKRSKAVLLNSFPSLFPVKKALFCMIYCRKRAQFRTKSIEKRGVFRIPDLISGKCEGVRCKMPHNPKSIKNLHPQWSPGQSGNPRGQPSNPLSMTGLKRSLRTGDWEEIDTVMQSMPEIKDQGVRAHVRAEWDAYHCRPKKPPLVVNDEGGE